MDGSVCVKLSFELVGFVEQMLADDVEDCYVVSESGGFVEVVPGG